MVSPRSLPGPWSNLITRYADVDPAVLLAHPDNWRIHPASQRAAVAAILDQYGWIDVIVVNEPTGRIIDGHLRVELALERAARVVPVGYVTLSEEKERYALAALDLVRGAAGHDREKVAGLFDELGSLTGAHAEAFAVLRARLLPGQALRSTPNGTEGPARVDHIDAALAAEDAFDTLTYGAADEGTSVEDAFERYSTSPVRQLVLAYTSEEYTEVVQLLARARTHYAVATHAEAVARLLDDSRADS